MKARPNKAMDQTPRQAARAALPALVIAGRSTEIWREELCADGRG